MARKKPYSSVAPDAKEVLPAHNKPFRGKVGSRVVENPYFEPGNPLSKKWIEVNTSLTSPLESLYHAKRIKPHQYVAGCELQRLFDLSEPANARGMDMSKDVVSGGRGESAADTCLRAYDRLKEVRAALGEYAYAVTRDVLRLGWTVTKVAQARGFTSNDDVRSHGFMFRQALDDAAEVLGLKGEAPSRKRIKDKFSTMAAKGGNYAANIKQAA